jgi:hypothetical protein
MTANHNGRAISESLTLVWNLHIFQIADPESKRTTHGLEHFDTLYQIRHFTTVTKLAVKVTDYTIEKTTHSVKNCLRCAGIHTMMHSLRGVCHNSRDL